MHYNLKHLFPLTKIFIILVLSIFIVEPGADAQGQGRQSSRAKEKVIAFEPKIDTVTVYPDRALVLRTQVLRLPAGKIRLKFKNASPSLRAKSMQAFCEQPGCFVQGVHSYIERNLSYNNPQMEKWNKKLDQIVLREEVQKNRIVRVRKEMSELKRYKKYLSKAIAHSSVETQSVQVRQWQAGVRFIRQRLLQAKAQRKDAEEKLTQLRERKKILQKKIRQIRSSGAKAKRIVEISVHNLKAGQAKVSFSYLIRNASWHVSYGMYLRKNNKIYVEYYGNVKQKTGEDWRNVNLRLSTAKPAFGAKRPRIYAKHVYGRKVRQKTVYRQTQTKMAVQKEDAPSPMKQGKSRNGHSVIKRGGLSLLFNITKKATILSKDQEQRVTITQFTTPQARLRYRLVPSVSRLAHLVAHVKHNSPYPILRGRADIYRFSGFVGQSHVSYTPANSKLIIGFGADRSIKVRRQVNRRSEKVGMLSKEKRFTTDIKTGIEFHGQNSYPLYVWERIPVSQVEEVKINLLSETTSGYEKIDERQGIIKWKLPMNQGEKKNIHLRYQVTVPKNFSGSVYGK